MRFKMKLYRILLLSVLLLAGACEAFKEDAPVYAEPVKNIEGKWQLMGVVRNGTDISQKMDFSTFRLFLNNDHTYTMQGHLPFMVRSNGQWQVDDVEYPHHITFRESGSPMDVTSEMKYPVVDGKRRISLTFSPGCVSNVYTWTFEKTEE